MLHWTLAYRYWPSAETAQAKPLTDAASGAWGVNHCTTLHCTLETCPHNSKGSIWRKYSASHESSCQAKH